MSDPQYASPEVSDAWRRDAPVWYGLISDLHKDPKTAEFARYVADDAQRAFSMAQVRAQAMPALAEATIAGHNEATQIIAPHREALTLMIEAPVVADPEPGESTLSMEAVPGDPDTFA